MASYTEPLRSYECVLSAEEGLSFDNVTVGIAADLTAGTVLGKKKFVQAAAPIPAIVGTGTGLMSALIFGPDVQVGSYVITLLATSATAAFSVVAPDGNALTNGAVGTAYKSTHLSFSIANGGTMTLGDKYTVVVSAAGTPVIVGTGSGVMSGITLDKYTQAGTYRVTVMATSSTGELQVTAPDGTKLPYGKIGTAYTSNQINFTVADGGTMTVGDYYNIIVANQSAVTGYYYAYDPTAVDGTQEPCAVLLQPALAASAAATATALTRLGEVKSASLAWKANVSAAEKVAAARQLLANSMIAVRS